MDAFWLGGRLAYMAGSLTEYVMYSLENMAEIGLARGLHRTSLNWVKLIFCSRFGGCLGIRKNALIWSGDCFLPWPSS
jgi:hypothetical protein